MLVTRDDGKVSIGKVLVVEMAGADMAGAASAWVCITGRGTSLWYLSPSISARSSQPLIVDQLPSQFDAEGE